MNLRGDYTRVPDEHPRLLDVLLTGLEERLSGDLKVAHMGCIGVGLSIQP